ncbi:Fur family transcriptional regulator [Proteiniclasticum sp. C24MP]|uniref:Fur family transcriptional regulator n=1 Tax=Proteiniclasticum sp. C24MP TaxID=3374101 RepID=UPI003754B819
MHSITKTFKNKGLKLTPQRIAVYEYLLGTREHPSAELIYSALIEKFPTMSLATVYKSLKTLCKVDLVQELNLGEGNFRYDAVMQEHAHFQCNHCNVVFDMMHVPTHMVMEAVSKNQNFVIESSKLYFYGTCTDCQGKSS